MKGSRASSPKFRRIGIVAKTASATALRLAASLERALKRRGRRVLFDEGTAEALRRPDGLSRDRISRETDLVLVLGGDGTMLSVARSAPRVDAPARDQRRDARIPRRACRARRRIPRLDEVLAGRFREDRRRRMDVAVSRGPAPRRLPRLERRGPESGSPRPHLDVRHRSGRAHGGRVPGRRRHRFDPDGLDRVQPVGRAARSSTPPWRPSS